MQNLFQLREGIGMRNTLVLTDLPELTEYITISPLVDLLARLLLRGENF